MNKNLIFGFIFILIVITGIFLLKPAKKCPIDKPYLEKGTCVVSCASGKRDDKKCLTATQNCPAGRPNLNDGVCVSTCPSNKVNDDGVCVSTCPSNKVNDEGVCISTCPSNKVNDEGVCISTCPSNKVNDEGVCVSACPANKVNDEGVCVSTCPTDKPAVISGVCSPCSSNTDNKKFNNNGVCVSTCPTDKPAVISGVCSPCSSNTDNKKFNNNGVCVSTCPSIRPNINGVCKPCSEHPNKINESGTCVSSCSSATPIPDNGFCKPKLNANQISPSLSTSANSTNTWLKAIDGNYDTFWEPALGISITNFWYIFKWTSTIKPFIKGIRIKFKAVNIPLNLNIYTNVDDDSTPIRTGDDLRQRDFSNNLVRSKPINNTDDTILQEELNITNVKNILVLFTNRTNIYEIQIY